MSDITPFDYQVMLLFIPPESSNLPIGMGCSSKLSTTRISTMLSESIRASIAILRPSPCSNKNHALMLKLITPYPQPQTISLLFLVFGVGTMCWLNTLLLLKLG